MTLKDFVYSLKKAGFRMEIEENGTVSFYHYRYNIMLFMYKKHVYIFTRDNINFTRNEWRELLNCVLEKLCSIERFKDFLKFRTFSGISSWNVATASILFWGIIG